MSKLSIPRVQGCANIYGGQCGYQLRRQAVAAHLAQPKVGDLGQPQRVKEDVGGLEVVMDDAVPRLVEVHQCVEDLGDDRPGLFLGERLCRGGSPWIGKRGQWAQGSLQKGLPNPEAGPTPCSRSTASRSGPSQRSRMVANDELSISRMSSRPTMWGWVSVWGT